MKDMEDKKKEPKENPQEPQAQTPPPAKGPAVDPQIDAIREIIFGQNIRQYNEQFDHINVEIDKLRVELMEKLMQTRSELENLISDLREDTTQKLLALRAHTDAEVSRLDEAKADRRLLGTLLVEIGEKIRKEA